MLRSESPRVLLWQLAAAWSLSRCGWCAMSCPEVHCGSSCTSAPWAPHSPHVHPQPDWCVSAIAEPRLVATPSVHSDVVRKQVRHIAVPTYHKALSPTKLDSRNEIDPDNSTRVSLPRACAKEC